MEKYISLDKLLKLQTIYANGVPIGARENITFEELRKLPTVNVVSFTEKELQLIHYVIAIPIVECCWPEEVNIIIKKIEAEFERLKKEK